MITFTFTPEVPGDDRPMIHHVTRGDYTQKAIEATLTAIEYLKELNCEIPLTRKSRVLELFGGSSLTVTDIQIDPRGLRIRVELYVTSEYCSCIFDLMYFGTLQGR